jgi:hypothetical protein
MIKQKKMAKILKKEEKKRPRKLRRMEKNSKQKSTGLTFPSSDYNTKTDSAELALAQGKRMPPRALFVL